MNLPKDVPARTYRALISFFLAILCLIVASFSIMGVTHRGEGPEKTRKPANAPPGATKTGANVWSDVRAQWLSYIFLVSGGYFFVRSVSKTRRR